MAAERAEMSGEPLALGPILVARSSPRSASGGPLDPVTQGRRRGGEFFAMYVYRPASAGRETGACAADVARPPAGDAQDCIALVAPHRFLTSILPVGRAPTLPAPSVALNVLQRYLDGLLALQRGRLCEEQSRFAASAVQALLAAALLPCGGDRGLGSRRRASLIDRISAYVDANLQSPMSVESLCEALGCSRSSLYRAAEGAGGVAELIVNRRLIAVRALLRDPRERRPIAELARTYCFSETAQFNRRFKARFGVTPGALRRSAGPPSPSRVLR